MRATGVFPGEREVRRDDGSRTFRSGARSNVRRRAPRNDACERCSPASHGAFDSRNLERRAATARARRRARRTATRNAAPGRAQTGTRASAAGFESAQTPAHGDARCAERRLRVLDVRAAERVHLVTGILERDGRILLVASRYPNLPEPLWNLPGGRQRDGELLDCALRREFLEETGLAVEVGTLEYVAESYDRSANVHFLSFCFNVTGDGEAVLVPDDAHAVELAWVLRNELAERVVVDVVRQPLLAHVAGTNPRRYTGFTQSGITIEFADPA